MNRLDTVYGAGSFDSLYEGWLAVGNEILPGTLLRLHDDQASPNFPTAIEVKGFWDHPDDPNSIGLVTLYSDINDPFLWHGIMCRSDHPQSGFYWRMGAVLIPWLRERNVEWLEIPVFSDPAVRGVLLGTGWELKENPEGTLAVHDSAFLDLTQEVTGFEEYIAYKQGRSSKPDWYSGVTVEQ